LRAKPQTFETFELSRVLMSLFLWRGPHKIIFSTTAQGHHFDFLKTKSAKYGLLKLFTVNKMIWSCGHFMDVEKYTIF